MVAATIAPSGLISLLHGDDVELQCFALKKLNDVVDQHWPEISDDITSIEILYEDQDFSHRELAALVASKVYYHLGDYAQSTTYALEAHENFDTSLVGDEYVETIITYCIDQFVQNESRAYDEIPPKISGTYDLPAEPLSKESARFAAIVERMLQRCYDDKEYKHAIGIGLEAKRLDIVLRTIRESRDFNLLPYILDTTIDLIQDQKFRNEVLAALVVKFSKISCPLDSSHMTKCFVNLQDSEGATTLLTSLMTAAGGPNSNLLPAFQVALDLEGSSSRCYSNKVDFLFGLEVKPESSSGRGEVDAELLKENPNEFQRACENIESILEGTTRRHLHLEFLQRNNKCDVAILNKIRDSLEARNSIFHSGLTFCNAFMNAGTTADGFFRANLDWLSKASNWSKFSATAALGVIHRGNHLQSTRLLKPYLPRAGTAGSVYSEGGSLFALGLIHANAHGDVVEELRGEFRKATDETIQHGAALGIGAAAFAYNHEETYDDLKEVLYHDSAVAGEAAGLSIGLVMIGSGSEQVVEEMVQYSHETEHEKIARGVAMGLAFVMYGRMNAARALITKLTEDDNPVIRYGGMFTIAMAYAGSGNTFAYERLLHFAVADVHDDVRRAAVIGLGFVMFRDLTTLCETVELLYESYNPHVRYGAAMALGIACAGTGKAEALILLDPMCKDTTDFVRQGAFIAFAMTLIQQNDQTNPTLVGFRKLLLDTIANKHSDAVSKFGATLACGILDAGGRNVTISLKTQCGTNDMQTIAGLVMFTQSWYWFPLAHFLCMSFTPTAFIGLNKDLDVPEFNFVSENKPFAFAYPPETPKEQNKTAEKVQTAVLSTTAKAKARAKKVKEEKAEAEAMETDATEVEDKMDTDDTETEKKADDNKKTSSQTTTVGEQRSAEIVHNFTRVLPRQLQYLHFDKGSRYDLVKKFTGGIIMLDDQEPEKEVQLLPIRRWGEAASMPEASVPEAPMPQEFEYPFDDEEE